MIRVLVFGAMIAIAVGLLTASWLGVGSWTPPFDDEPTRETAEVRKRVEDGRRFRTGEMRGTELTTFQDSLAEVARRDSVRVVRTAEQDSIRQARGQISAAAIAAGRPDPFAPTIRSTPTYGGGYSGGK